MVFQGRYIETITETWPVLPRFTILTINRRSWRVLILFEKLLLLTQYYYIVKGIEIDLLNSGATEGACLTFPGLPPIFQVAMFFSSTS